MARHRSRSGHQPSDELSRLLQQARSGTGRGSHRLVSAPPLALRGRAALGAVAAGAVVAASAAFNAESAVGVFKASADPMATLVAGAQADVQLGQGGTEGRVSMPVARSILISGATDKDQLVSLVKGERISAERAAQAEAARAEAARAEAARAEAVRAEAARAEAARKAQAAREAEARSPRCVRPAAGVLTSGYGLRWGSMHAGIDIANRIGTPILAAAAGVVVESGPASGFGLWVRVKHADGTTTVYGHIDRSLVRAGQQVKAGQQIATMGNRGESTGPHLHFEVWTGNGAKINPLTWLRSNGAQI